MPVSYIFINATGAVIPAGTEIEIPIAFTELISAAVIKTGTVFPIAFPILAPNGTAANPSYAFASSPNTGWYSGSFGKLSAVASGSSVFEAIAGASRFFNLLRIADGAVGTPGLAFQNNYGLGLYRIGADNLGIAAGGVHRLSVSAAGTAPELLKVKRTEAAAEPTLTDDETALWWDTATSKMYLITRRSGTQYKVQMI